MEQKILNRGEDISRQLISDLTWVVMEMELAEMSQTKPVTWKPTTEGFSVASTLGF